MIKGVNTISIHPCHGYFYKFASFLTLLLNMLLSICRFSSLLDVTAKHEDKVKFSVKNEDDLILTSCTGNVL